MPAAPLGPAADAERRRRTRRILFFARLSFILVGTMPFWVPLARAYLPLGPLGLALDGLFVVVCHRRLSRTLLIAGLAMPVCSRCAGIFAGLALGALTCWPRPTLKQARNGLLAAGALMVADVLLQDLGIHPLWHSTRLLTGILLGYIMAVALMAAIRRERRRQPSPVVPAATGAEERATAGREPEREPKSAAEPEPPEQPR